MSMEEEKKIEYVARLTAADPIAVFIIAAGFRARPLVHHGLP